MPWQAPSAPDLVEVYSVSTTDSREVTVVYDIIGPDLTEPFDIGIFRSSTAIFGSGISVEVGLIHEQADGACMKASDGTWVRQSQVSGDFLTSGYHTETLALSNSSVTDGNVVLAAPLAPDPQLSDVIAVADPDGNQPWNFTPDNTDAHFHIYVIGAVVQGFGADQSWVEQMTGALYKETYEKVFPVHWHSLAIEPGWAVEAGNNLYTQIVEYTASIVSELEKNDVIDVHLIGHSRGAAVIDQTMIDLDIFTSLLPPQLAHGFYKMTMLDPHPANLYTIKDISINPLLWPLAILDPIGQLLYSDPSIVVPRRINQLEDYYQKSAYNALVHDHYWLETYFNLQGLSLNEITIQDQGQTITTQYDMTNWGLGHTEVHGWYEDWIIPTLGHSLRLPIRSSLSSGDPSAAASQLAIIPSSTLLLGADGNLDPCTGVPFTLYVFALNAQGNPDPTFTGSVTLGLATNPGNSVLGGTLTVNAVNGVATFSDLTITNPGSGYTFEATSDGLTSATSVPIDVEPYQLVLTSPPPDSVTAGSGFGLAVTVEDGAGNVDTSFNGNVTVALGDYFGGTVPLGGTVTVQADQGVATFSGLTIGPAGDYLLIATSDGSTGTSSPISVTAAAASRLEVSFQPGDDVTAGSGFDLVIYAEDAEGNVDTTFDGDVTLALANNPSGGNLGGTLTVPAINGIANFIGLTIDTAGIGYTLDAASTGLSPATSNPLNITAPGVATHLVVTTEPPSTITAGTGFTLAVSAEDDFGTVDTSFQGNVIIAIEYNASDIGTLGGTLTLPAVAGVATFSGLTLSTADNKYILQASSADLAAGLTNAVDVTPLWDGGSTANNLWTTKENWAGDTAPLPGDNLIFPAGAEQLVNFNDYPSGTIFGSITVSGSGYQIQGNAYQSSTFEVQANTNVEVNSIFSDTLNMGAGSVLNIAPIAGGWHATNSTLTPLGTRALRPTSRKPIAQPTDANTIAPSTSTATTTVAAGPIADSTILATSVPATSEVATMAGIVE